MAEETVYKQSYQTSFDLQFQQMGPRLPGTLINVTNSAAFDFHDRISTIDDDNTDTSAPGRKEDTRYYDVDYTRRRIHTTSNRWNTLRRLEDVIRMSGDPNSQIVMNAVAYMARTTDRKIITALLGTAYGGVNGATETSFDTTNQRVLVDHVDGNSAGDGTNRNLTPAKLRRVLVKEYSQEAWADGEEAFCVANIACLEALLRELVFTSADYAEGKRLVDGQVARAKFLGFTFVRSEHITYSSSNVRRVLCYSRTAGKYATQAGMPLTTRITPEVPTKNHDTQISVWVSDGAVRDWEEKIVDVLCDETK